MSYLLSVEVARKIIDVQIHTIGIDRGKMIFHLVRKINV